MRGKLFYFSRFFVRLCIGRWSAGVAEPEGPAVYVCSHNNLLGPLAALCWLPFDVRPWTLHVFLLLQEGVCGCSFADPHCQHH